MAELVKPWNDGGNLSISYDGDRDGSAIFSSDSYEGIDREMEVRFIGGGASLTRKVRQEGIRQTLGLLDGGVFRIADDGRFGVIKQPRSYTEIDYLESNGNQWIDSGFNPTTNSRMVLDFQPTKKQNACYAGRRHGQSLRAFTINSGNSGTRQYAAFASSGNVSLGSFTQERQTISISQKEFIRNGEIIETGITTELLGTYTIYLFACNTDGATLNASCRIYSCKIYDNDVLVRDLIPVLDKDGIACMYDKINKVFLYNQGTGDFIVPEIV